MENPWHSHKNPGMNESALNTVLWGCRQKDVWGLLAACLALGSAQGNKVEGDRGGHLMPPLASAYPCAQL